MSKSTPRRIAYYFWLLSDWAYLGGVRFAQLAARHDLSVDYIPLRLPDVYARSGGLVLQNRAWQRQAYRIHELKRWRARLGMVVNIEPAFFPTDIDLASCMVIAAQNRGVPVAGLVNAMMRAVWAEDRDLAQPGTLAAIATAEGLDATGLLAEADWGPVRATYRRNTERALDAGVFGSPFYHFNGELFWGQDRLDMLEEAVVASGSRELGRSP